MPDLNQELRDLARADHHIEMAHARVERQRELVDRLLIDGHDATEAAKLLATLESVLQTFIEHRDTILEAVATARKQPKTDTDTGLPPGR